METVRDMRGVLGGLRNMFRQWRINYLRNKKKKQKEIEEGKLAKYYALKRITYSGLALIYYPFGLFHTQTKKITKDYSDLVNIQKDILSIQKKASQISARQKEKEIVKLEKRLVVAGNKIAKAMNRKDKTDQDEITQTLQQLKREIDTLKKPPVISTKQVSIKPNCVIPEKENATIDSQNQIKGKDGIKVKFEPVFIDSPLKKVAEQHELSIKNKIGFSLEKDAEKEEVKKWKQELESLAYKISTTKEYHLFYEFEKKLKECKEKLETMVDGLEKDNASKILSDIETKERKKPIAELLDQVYILEKTIVERKKQIYFAKKQDRVEEQKTVRQEQSKEERKQKKESVISEWEQAQILIIQQIETQQKLLAEFEKRKIKNGKKGLFKTLSNLASNAMGFLFSMTPMAFFKNKLLGTFITAIMVNNSLKSMKKLLHPQEEINYEWLGQELKEKQSILENVYRVSLDSLYQINVIKEDVMFLLKENPQNMEILSFLNQLEAIEKQTLVINERVKMEGKIIDRQYTKIFTKGA